TGVKFTGSDMKSANFFRAICDECDFSDADCKMALFDKASLANAVFRNACLEHAGFDKAKAPGLLLEGATGVYTRFTGTDLTRAKAANSKLETPIFDDSTLEDADFTGAKLIKASLRAVKARGIILNEADVTAFCAGMKADLREAKCISLVGDRSIWENADLTGADFSFSSLQRAFFPEANCAKAVFYACNLSDSMMRKARLHAASFVQANLRNAELPKAECIGTDFSGSNLYETVFMDATVLECNFTGASRAHIIPRP
ncbi:MAG: pentapeptide repeat-containing protein, partial [Planctomycetota bacterium]